MKLQICKELLFRPRDWQKEERRKHKLERKVSWYRPADCVGFFPPTPRGELVSEINEVLDTARPRWNKAPLEISMGHGIFHGPWKFPGPGNFQGPLEISMGNTSITVMELSRTWNFPGALKLIRLNIYTPPPKFQVFKVLYCRMIAFLNDIKFSLWIN